MSKQAIREESAIIEGEPVDVVSREQDVFYNKDMASNRTMTVKLLQALGTKGMIVALPMAGTGVRAVRLLKELDEDAITTIKANDLKEEATRQIHENVRRNDADAEKVIITTKDGNEFFQGEKGFDYIDIDPFGSPNIVLNEAIMHARDGAILAMTATDTAALAGTYPEACKQKYCAVSSLMPQQHEMGLRILTRKAVMTGMQYAKRLEPILTYHHKHYYRIFFKVHKGKSEAALAYEHINSYFKHCPGCGYHQTSKNPETGCPQCMAGMKVAGPLFDGRLNDTSIATKVQEVLDENDNENRTIISEIIEQETVDAVGFYDTHQLSKAKKVKAVKVSELIEKLHKKGWLAVRPREVRTGVKTDAEFETIKDALGK
ncbi:MAG: hypothetical protein ACOCZV_01645 [Nanoarchaeota archaeon]